MILIFDDEQDVRRMRRSFVTGAATAIVMPALGVTALVTSQAIARFSAQFPRRNPGWGIPPTPSLVAADDLEVPIGTGNLEPHLTILRAVDDGDRHQSENLPQGSCR